MAYGIDAGAWLATAITLYPDAPMLQVSEHSVWRCPAWDDVTPESAVAEAGREWRREIGAQRH